jgi:hypothetical protein
LPSRLLTAPGVGCPSPFTIPRPHLLGLAPSLSGAFCEEVVLRLLYGLPPSANEDSTWEVARSRPRGLLITGLESSDGAAHPSGGHASAVHEHLAAGTAEAVALPHSVAERAASSVRSSATAPHAATVAAAPPEGGTAATVEQACGAPPGPTRATTTLASRAQVPAASTLHDPIPSSPPHCTSASLSASLPSSCLPHLAAGCCTALLPLQPITPRSASTPERPAGWASGSSPHCSRPNLRPLVSFLSTPTPRTSALPGPLSSSSRTPGPPSVLPAPSTFLLLISGAPCAAALGLRATMASAPRSSPCSSVSPCPNAS